MEMGHPNHKKGFKCNLTNKLENGWELEDFCREKKTIASLDDLYELYILFTNQQKEKYLKIFPGLESVKRDEYTRWMVSPHVGICPQSIISSNSKYWLELISYCDGEMGLNMPAPLHELPDLFFQALGIVRKVRSDLRKEEEKNGTKKNSHNN